MEKEDIEVGVVFQAYRIEIPVSEKRGKLFGYFIHEEIGLELAKGGGWCNGGGCARTVNLIKLKNGDIVATGNKPIDISFASTMLEAKKQEALRKLTPGDRILLGL